jgi:hypothetical protein
MIDGYGFNTGNSFPNNVNSKKSYHEEPLINTRKLLYYAFMCYRYRSPRPGREKGHYLILRRGSRGATINKTKAPHLCEAS